MNTLTGKEVDAIVAAEKSAQATAPPGFDPRQSARVRMHAALLEKNPMPCSTLTPEMWAARNRRKPLTHVEREEQMAYQRAQMTEEHHEDFKRARADNRHLDAEGRIMIVDALHHTQMLHGKAIWAEVDRLLEVVK